MVNKRLGRSNVLCNGPPSDGAGPASEAQARSEPQAPARGPNRDATHIPDSREWARSLALAALSTALMGLVVSLGTVLAQEWHEDAKLTAADATEQDYFGVSVSINERNLLAGPVCPCNGDIYPPGGNGLVDLDDVNAIIGCLVGTYTDPACDIDCNGMVNTGDACILVCLYVGGSGCCSGPVGACCFQGEETCLETTPIGCCLTGATHLGAGTMCGGDPDADGFFDACDNCPSFPNPGQNDANGNGIGDACDDCNSNLVLDACDLACGPAGGLCDVAGCGGSADCNANGIPDECDIADCRSLDRNSNGIPDECETICADVAPCGGNGIIDVDDIVAVLNAFIGAANPCGCGP